MLILLAALAIAASASPLAVNDHLLERRALQPSEIILGPRRYLISPRSVPLDPLSPESGPQMNQEPNSGYQTDPDAGIHSLFGPRGRTVGHSQTPKNIFVPAHRTPQLPTTYGNALKTIFMRIEDELRSQ